METTQTRLFQQSTGDIYYTAQLGSFIAKAAGPKEGDILGFLAIKGQANQEALAPEPCAFWEKVKRIRSIAPTGQIRDNL